MGELVNLKSHVVITSDGVVRRALYKHWNESSLRAEQAAPLIAKVLMRPLNALGFDLRRKIDLELMEYMLKGWFNSEVLWRPDGSPLMPVQGGSAAGDYLEQKVMEHLFRNSAIFTPPANVYIGLTTTATDDTNTGGTEVSGGAYARQAVGTTSGWTAPGSTGGATDNAAAITFPTATANWGTVSDQFGQDASTVGNRFFHAALTASKTINNGDQALFAIGDLDVSLA